MPSIMPYFKLLTWSFLSSFFNLFVFQTPYLSNFAWRIYLIYSAETGFEGFYVSNSGYFFNVRHLAKLFMNMEA
jgi:hypothetical protein